MNRTDALSYTEAAEFRMPDGPTWHCKTCGHDWKDNEHMARYCCSVNALCGDCGCVIPKCQVRCDECGEKCNLEEWKAKPEIPWNGEFPIANADSYSEDAFFYNMDQFIYWLGERDENETLPDSKWYLIRDAKITSCDEDGIPSFDFYDDIFESSDVESDFWPSLDKEGRKIEDAVNQWLKDNWGTTWRQSGDRIRVADLQKAVDAYLKESE